MNDDNHDQVGSVGEEAAKLLGALREWARSEGVGGIGDRLQDIDQHLATGGEDCRYCPVCRTIHVVREASPEVRDNLLSAATSLMQAAAGFLASQTPQGAATSGVEHIDLDDLDDEEDL